MEINLTRSERIIAIVALIAISVFFVMFLLVSRGTKAAPQFATGSAIDYAMARPDQAYSEYTLDGREIDHNFEGLPQEGVHDKLTKVKKDLIAKKAAETKKKEEIKKKETAQAQSQLQTKLKEKLYAQKIVDKSRSNSDSKTETAQNYSNNYGNNNSAQAQNQDAANNPKPNKKSYTEWRNILFSSPTNESLALFLAAYHKKEVTAAELQIMAQDLIDQSDIKLKALGLMTLRAAPSLASLSQMVHLVPASLGSYQSYVDQSINTYLQPQNLQYLNQALLTKDKILVVKSLTLLSTSLTKFSQGDLTGLVDPRSRREGEVVNFSMSNYNSLIPVLSQIGTSSDQELSGLAQQITALIQTTNKVAQN